MPSAPEGSDVAVLVVDDEETVRALLARIVTSAGGEAQVAGSAREARRLVESGRDFACAVVDKNLPDESGLELLAFLRERSPETQCLVVTGYANMDSAIEALRLGAFDYIVKPFQVAPVAHRIRLALERHRLRRELDTAFAELRRANAVLAESREEVKRAYLETTLRLARAAEYHDRGAGDHITRMSRYAGLLARAVDATDEWVENVTYAAPLHDIGNLGVPEAILRKPGPLTPAERAAMREHVSIGAHILEGTHSDVVQLAREVVLAHHERWDGGGYPRGLRGPEAPLSGRIVALCDAWDALTTDRCYRKARSVEVALDEIRAGAGVAYDPMLVEAFLDTLAPMQAVLVQTGSG